MRFAEMTQDVMISRPTPVSTPNILGLKSGRGNIYREAIKKAKEQGGELRKKTGFKCINVQNICSLFNIFASLNLIY